MKNHLLSAKQLQAIELFIGGSSDVEVCAAIDITLTELQSWKKRDPNFIAELNSRRKMVWDNSVDQLRSIIPTALTALQDVLTDSSSSQRWRAAIEVIKIVGMNPASPHDMGRIIGPDNPAEIERRFS